MLIDTGSTHNFISQDIVKSQGIPSNSCPTLKVQLADGSVSHCNNKVEGLQWRMADKVFRADFYSIPLGGYDAILGVQWLTQVSPVCFDFSKQLITINWEGSKVVLSQHSSTVDVKVHLEEKELKYKGAQACFLVQLTAITGETEDNQLITPEIQQVLDKFPKVFAVPKELPPARPQDHLIPISEGSKPVHLNPYKCPYLQRVEIEKMVREMLDSGIIKHSQSPYSSPVL